MSGSLILHSLRALGLTVALGCSSRASSKTAPHPCASSATATCAGAGGDAGDAGASGAGGGAGEGGEGTSGGGGDGAGGAPGEAVRGRVVTWLTTPGAPIANAQVVIDGTTVLTDDEGRFTIPDVSPRYDAIVLSGPNSVGVFLGLSEREPVLVGVASGQRTAEIRGQLSGGAGFPNPAAHSSSVAFKSPDYGQGGLFFAMGPDAGPEYPLFTASWRPSLPSSQGEAYALQWESNGPLPLAYKGFGSSPVAVSNGGLYESVDVVLEPIEDRDLELSVETPPGVVLTDVSLLVGELVVMYYTTPPESVVFRVPNGLGESYPTRVLVKGGQSGAISSVETVVADAEATLEASLPPVPNALLPADGAMGVGTSTPFSWEIPPNSISFVSFATASGMTLDVFTAGTSLTIPDLAEIGFPLPSGVAYDWTVRALGPAESVEGFFAGFDTNPPVFWYGEAPARGFTTD